MFEGGYFSFPLPKKGSQCIQLSFYPHFFRYFSLLFNFYGIRVYTLFSLQLLSFFESSLLNFSRIFHFFLSKKRVPVIFLSFFSFFHFHFFAIASSVILHFHFFFLREFSFSHSQFISDIRIMLHMELDSGLSIFSILSSSSHFFLLDHCSPYSCLSSFFHFFLLGLHIFGRNNMSMILSFFTILQ